MRSLLLYISFIAVLLFLFKSIIPCTSDKHELVAAAGGLKPSTSSAQSSELVADANYQDGEAAGSPYVGKKLGVQIKKGGSGRSHGGSKKNTAAVTTAACTYLLYIPLLAVGYFICFL
ncbi:hypothetical protein Dimus_002478 [Dionaea muscipula]